MTGRGRGRGRGRCQRRRKSMAGDRGAAIPLKIETNCEIPKLNPEITEKPSDSPGITKIPPTSTSDIDLYAQARKSLSLRSPFDSEDSQAKPAAVSSFNYLPTGVLHLLNRHSDNRRLKKLQSGTEKNSSATGKARRSNIWVENEEYFRELALEDVERLEKLSLGVVGNERCFSIPYLVGNDNLHVYYDTFNRMLTSTWKKDRPKMENGVGTKQNGELGFVERTLQEKNELNSMDVEGGDVVTTEFQKEKSNGGKKINSVDDSISFSGVEWLLGSKRKIYLASERPSKRRKHLGRDAGLEKLLVARPVEDLESVCHYCGYGDTCNPLNLLINCSSCGMVVHQRCYGVQDDVESYWLCSWCKLKNVVDLNTETPCMLCPKQGGALKPVQKKGVGRGIEVTSLEFAHLFCCQWMPEVYLENTRTMELIMNLDELKDTRRKLICYLCKVKHGACVRCSNGSCRTSFHPICAREAGHRMEIWAKIGSDEVELRAFCTKHSELQCNNGSQEPADVSLTADLESDVDLSVLVGEDSIDPSGDFTDTAKKILIDSEQIQDDLANNSIKVEDELRALVHFLSEDGPDKEIVQSQPMTSCSPVLQNGEFNRAAYIHPFIYTKLMQTKNVIDRFPSSQSMGDRTSRCSGVNLDQLVEARNMGILKLSPEDEAEGELIYYQQRLLSNAVLREHASGDLISKVVTSLPNEMGAARNRKWDEVLVSHYHHEVKEAKKQGRKERRHKEAQALLAAATAAAAASTRSTIRKDTPEESSQQEDVRQGIFSQPNLRVKETVSRIGFARSSFDTNIDSVQLASDFSKDHPSVCEVCRRSETALNPILVCSSCKLAVHMDCYRSVKSTSGPWHCELCEDLFSSRTSLALETNSWEKPCFVAECGLCGGTAGAFRKSVDGQWIHALCAEWVLESTYRRGQVNPIGGMDSISKGVDACTVCRRRHGVCLKCSYGHCQATFHPTCARSAGFYMTVRTNGDKLKHKAYCERHSTDQRAKADTQKHGIEEFKSLKQIRVELERLRLLCERVIKREKLKRELVICSHDYLGSSRDSVVSALARHPFYQAEVSSESATTSLKGGYTDVTVDMDNDGKTDDSSTSQNHLYTLKPVERVSFSGKQVPKKLSLEDDKKLSKQRKPPETFEKELLMTSDEASMKNQRLPKGFVYVPIRRLPTKEESTDA